MNRAYHDTYYLIDKYAPFAANEGPTKLKSSDWATLPQERDHALAKPVQTRKEPGSADVPAIGAMGNTNSPYLVSFVSPDNIR